MKEVKEEEIFPGVNPGIPLQAAFTHQGREGGPSPLSAHTSDGTDTSWSHLSGAARTRENELSKAVVSALSHLKPQFPSRRRKARLDHPHLCLALEAEEGACASYPPSRAFCKESG